MRAVIGGTFDNLHKGHEEFIGTACEASDFLVIGLTSDQYAAGHCKYKNKLQSYNIRLENLKKFLEANNYAGKAKIEKINDEVGIATKYDDLDTIFCTLDTAKNAELVNLRRAQRASKPLKVIFVPLLAAEDGKLISSERIRKGEIDREGRILNGPARG